METGSDDARTALDIVGEAKRAAYAPNPLPRWYTPTIAAAMSVFWAVQDVDRVAVKAVAGALYTAVVAGTIALVTRQQGRRTRVSSMPPALRRNTLVSGLALITALGVVLLALWLLDLPHPWLWFAVISFPIVIVGGRLAERSYDRGYARWLAQP